MKPSGAEQTSDRTRRASDMTARRRTATSSAGGSSSPGPPGRWSLRCSSAGTDPPSCCKLLQTPAGDAVLAFDHQGTVRSFPVPSYSNYHFLFVMNEWMLWMYLIVIKLAVLQADRGGDSAHTSVGVVVGILAHTVWETLLWERGTVMWL